MKSTNTITVAIISTAMTLDAIEAFASPRSCCPIRHRTQQPSRLPFDPIAPSIARYHYTTIPISILQMATSEELEKEISAMKANEIRQELESYGISTKSFFEKSELVEVLVKARIDGKTPVETTVNGADGDFASQNSSTSSASSSRSSPSSETSSRLVKIQQEIEKCKSMKVGELKKELDSYGISTKSFFEKSEFVRAVAEARVDGVSKTDGGGSGRSSGGAKNAAREEPRDPSYRDVVVTKFQGGKGMLTGKVIDVKSR
mmetsp:Transcript_2169/g.4666  ORF Transcript_2169/g.4666 Transcript_2169/m.4666 type:complete len:260 (+) Transcript_2169:156-935(+)